jgi:hypothetical protein
MSNRVLLAVCLILALVPARSFAEDAASAQVVTDIFDDKALIDGYSAKLANASKDLLLAMINDDELNVHKKTAAVIVFRDKFAAQTVSKEKIIVERVFLRQLQKVNSVYFQIVIMRTLVIIDRYKYFDSMVPLLIQKMDHYDPYVNELAYSALEDINSVGSQRPREARIILNTLRKIFFLSRKKIAKEDVSEPKLRNKLQLLRWAIKVLGVDELKTLPSEVIGLM